MFGKKLSSARKDAKIARSIQYLTRVGVVSPLAIAGGQFTHLGLIGVLLAEGAAGRGAISKVGDVLDYVANHPNMWKSLKATGEAATGTAGANVGKAAAAVAGQTVSGANSNPRSFVPENPDKAKRNVYGSLSGTGLTGNEATHPGAR
jgi:hypothetical protein